MTERKLSVPARLLRAVTIKTALELALLCVIATVAAFSNFSPLLRGAVDIAGPETVAGWAYDPQSPGETIEVQVFIDGRFVASGFADRPRPDLVTAGAAADPNHGFSIPIAGIPIPTGKRIVQVYALRPSSGGARILSPLSRSGIPIDVSP